MTTLSCMQMYTHKPYVNEFEYRRIIFMHDFKTLFLFIWNFYRFYIKHTTKYTS